MEFQPKGIKMYLKQLLSTLVVNLLSACTGAYFASSSVIIHHFMDKEADEYFTVNFEDGSWIATCGLLGTFFGTVFVGFLVNFKGYKFTIIVGCVLTILGELIQIFAQNLPVLCFGRFILGMVAAITKVTVGAFVGDLSIPKTRSVNAFMYYAMYTLGLTFITLVATLFSWRYACSLSILYASIGLIGISFLHESPYWLIKKGQMVDAVKSLLYYNRTYKQMEKELTTAQKIDYNENGPDSKRLIKPGSLSAKINRLKAKVVCPTFYKPLIYLTVYGVLLEASSFPAITSYLIKILYETGTPFSPHWSATIINSFRLLACLIGLGFNAKFRRRHIFFTWGIVLLSTLLGLVLYCHGFKMSYLPEVNYLPMILIMVVFMTYPCGYGSPFVVFMSELFPSDVKFVGTAFVNLWAIGISTILIKMTPSIMSSLSLYGMFGMYAVVTIITLIHGAVYMPETNNKTLAEIQDYYQSSTFQKEKPQETDQIP